MDETVQNMSFEDRHAIPCVSCDENVRVKFVQVVCRETVTSQKS